MKLLIDNELQERINKGELIIEGFKESDKSCWQDKNSAIQPCSLDLHIGEIFIPQEEDKSLTKHCLKPGETVVIRTIETLHLSNKCAAIGFPPSSISQNGILTTNPGHVDPGYRGPFHITLINMGQKAYPLEKGGLIVTLLVFELDSFSKGYLQRRNNSCQKEECPCIEIGQCDSDYNKTRKKPSELDYLASDFMNFEPRTKDIAKEAIRDAETSLKKMKILLSILTPIIVVLISGFFGYLNMVKSGKIEALEKINAESRLQKIEKSIDEFEYKEKIASIEKELKVLNEKLHQ